MDTAAANRMPIRGDRLADDSLGPVGPDLRDGIRAPVRRSKLATAPI